MPDLDDLFEARLAAIPAKRISLPRTRSFRPERFAPGTGKGGQFAPKGMGTTAYAAVKKAMDADVDVRPYGRGIWRVEDSTSGVMTPDNARSALLNDAVFQRLIDEVVADPARLRRYTDADGNPSREGGRQAYIDWYQAPRGRRDPERSSIYTPDTETFSRALIDGVAQRRSQPAASAPSRALAMKMLFGRTPGGRAVGATPIYSPGAAPALSPGFADRLYDEAKERVSIAMRDLSVAEGSGAPESRLQALKKKVDDANAALWFAAIDRGGGMVTPAYMQPQLFAFGDAAGSSSSSDFLSASKFIRDAGTAASGAQEWLSKNPGASGPDVEGIKAMLSSSQPGRDFLTDVRGRKNGVNAYSEVVRDAQAWLDANPGEVGPEAEAIRKLASGTKANRGIWKGIAGKGLTGNVYPESVQKAARDRIRANRARSR